MVIVRPPTSDEEPRRELRHQKRRRGPCRLHGADRPLFPVRDRPFWRGRRSIIRPTSGCRQRLFVERPLDAASVLFCDVFALKNSRFTGLIFSSDACGAPVPQPTTAAAKPSTENNPNVRTNCACLVGLPISKGFRKRYTIRFNHAWSTLTSVAARRLESQ
jgi:hypothetical protein